VLVGWAIHLFAV